MTLEVDGWEGRVRQPLPPIFILGLKRKSQTIFVGEGNFFLGAISLGKVVVPSSKIVSNLAEKLHCKGEPYRFSGLKNLAVHTDTQTIRHTCRHPGAFI